MSSSPGPGPRREPLRDGLRLTVTGRPAPATRLFVAAGRRMSLRQDDRDVLLARVQRDHGGVDVLRLPGWRWLLSWRELPPYTLVGDLVRDYPDCDLDWFGGWHGALPLVVLWWQSGLDGYLVVDGHDRLVAAHDAGTSPPALVLSRASDGAWLTATTKGHENALRHVDTEIAKGTPGAPAARIAVAAGFVTAGPGTPRHRRPGRGTPPPPPA